MGFSDHLYTLLWELTMRLRAFGRIRYILPAPALRSVLILLCLLTYPKFITFCIPASIVLVAE